MIKHVNQAKVNGINPYFYKAALVLFFLLISRLLAMYFVPLNDSTESRYAEIAREMLAYGNWITLSHNYGVPFLAKPPLSTWLSALSMGLFGVNEFAARLPSLLLSIGILGLVGSLAKKQASVIVSPNESDPLPNGHFSDSSGTTTTLIAILVLASSLYFFIDAGAVMTDPSLLFCTTLTFVSFWHAIHDKPHKLWSYVFFISLGLGLLAKGLLAAVLTLTPIIIWSLWTKKLTVIKRHFPWTIGVLIILIIALPWYYLAEKRTPGFLNYFIIGEHFSRFVQTQWPGDKYGYAHAKPYGMIWVYALLGSLPWCIVGFIWLRKNLSCLCHDNDGFLKYLLLFMLIPLLFFTLAKNIIYPYILPSLPAFALLFAVLWNRSHTSIHWLWGISLITGIGVLMATLGFQLFPHFFSKSQKPIIMAFKMQKPTQDAKLIYWAPRLEYSAEFYSRGKAIATSDPSRLKLLLSNSNNFMVVKAKDLKQVPEDLLAHFIQVSTIKVTTNTMILFKHADIKTLA